jgi:hypothetical protein
VDCAVRGKPDERQLLAHLGQLPAGNEVSGLDRAFRAAAGVAGLAGREFRHYCPPDLSSAPTLKKHPQRIDITGNTDDFRSLSGPVLRLH